LRIRGELLLEKGDAVEAAEQSFGTALAQAQAISDRTVQLASYGKRGRDQ
jgi:hypothetical protein